MRKELRQTTKALQEQVRFARARFGNYDVIDFVAVLIGYILSGEPTLQAFYERLAPFAEPFMALFGRTQIPQYSPLSGKRSPPAPFRGRRVQCYLACASSAAIKKPSHDARRHAFTPP